MSKQIFKKPVIFSKLIKHFIILYMEYESFCFFLSEKALSVKLSLYSVNIVAIYVLSNFWQNRIFVF